jgi:hypothetical protein
MAYATTCVYGATHWKAPVWIGRPVQWVGIVYAYALTLLAQRDDTFDWLKLAEGILIAGEQQQAVEGPNVGCLADNIELKTQAMFHPWINPCSLANLRMRLDGCLDGLALASDGTHRVVAPFPVEIRDGAAHVQAGKGLSYQAVIDGERIVTIESAGLDVVDLEAGP